MSLRSAKNGRYCPECGRNLAVDWDSTTGLKGRCPIHGWFLVSTKQDRRQDHLQDSDVREVPVLTLRQKLWRNVISPNKKWWGGFFGFTSAVLLLVNTQYPQEDLPKLAAIALGVAGLIGGGAMLGAGAETRSDSYEREKNARLRNAGKL